MIRLLDSEWERIRERFPEENIPDGRPGRKPVPTRLVLEAVLWILNTGAQWHMLNYKTVHRRLDVAIAVALMVAAATRAVRIFLIAITSTRMRSAP